MIGSAEICRKTERPTCQGAVLLVVLAVLVLVLALTSTWITTTGGVHREALALRDRRLHADFMRQGELLARSWIKLHAAQAVSPVDGGGWTAIDDHVESGGLQVRLQVTLFDGWSGLPLSLIDLRGPLRPELPPTLSSLPITPISSPSEELAFTANDVIERFPLPPGIRRFPDPGWHAGQGTTWLAPGQKRTSSFLSNGTSLASAPADVVSLIINPHSDGRINLNTAPISLVRTVCRLRGIGLPEHLIENRRKGIRTTSPLGSADGGSSLPQLVDFTLVWNCLITVTCNNHSQSWWVVLVGNPDNLRIVQRHDADQ